MLVWVTLCLWVSISLVFLRLAGARAESENGYGCEGWWRLWVACSWPWAEINIIGWLLFTIIAGIILIIKGARGNIFYPAYLMTGSI